jgi:hypothetical protein
VSFRRRRESPAPRPFRTLAFAAVTGECSHPAIPENGLRVPGATLAIVPARCGRPGLRLRPDADTQDWSTTPSSRPHTHGDRDRTARERLRLRGRRHRKAGVLRPSPGAIGPTGPRPQDRHETNLALDSKNGPARALHETDARHPGPSACPSPPRRGGRVHTALMASPPPKHQDRTAPHMRKCHCRSRPDRCSPRPRRTGRWPPPRPGTSACPTRSR